MTTHAYTGDQLVEQPAVGLFAQLGWQTACAMEEVFGKDGTLGRETPGKVVLVYRGPTRRTFTTRNVPPYSSTFTKTTRGSQSAPTATPREAAHRP